MQNENIPKNDKIQSRVSQVFPPSIRIFCEWTETNRTWYFCLQILFFFFDKYFCLQILLLQEWKVSLQNTEETANKGYTSANRNHT